MGSRGLYLGGWVRLFFEGVVSFDVLGGGFRFFICTVLFYIVL